MGETRQGGRVARGFVVVGNFDAIMVLDRLKPVLRKAPLLPVGQASLTSEACLSDSALTKLEAKDEACPAPSSQNYLLYCPTVAPSYKYSLRLSSG